jgi:hypothetical protein
VKTKSRVKSLELNAELKVEIHDIHTARRRRFWKRTPLSGCVILSVEGAPSIRLYPGDTLTINHRITEGPK